MNIEEHERKNVYEVYNEIAVWYAENRRTELNEKKQIDSLLDHLPPGGLVLDLGCGTGKPMLEYLVRKSVNVVGVDASREMLKIAKANFPTTDFILQDMRFLNLDVRFDAIIAWNSLFHLPATDQPVMFKMFEEHINPKGILLFTSGIEYGETWGINGGKNLFHASLDAEEYENLLIKHNFRVLNHVVNDPDCGSTIWMAQYCPQVRPLL